MSLQLETDCLFASDIGAQDHCDSGGMVQPYEDAGFASVSSRYCKCSWGKQAVLGCIALILPGAHPAHGKHGVWCLRDFFHNLEHGVGELHVWMRLAISRT